MENKKEQQLPSYTENLYAYTRWITREVPVGAIGIGGQNPIRIQSMTTTDTMDTEATVEQSIRMIEAGCELIRITAPSKKEAENLRAIKETLNKRGFTAPLIADIHFTPNAAEVAARIVEKVRVNPGNYVDKKKFETLNYSEAEYAEEIERIRLKFSPLVELCKKHGTAMRIGTNHGSLSDRILSRYGDTPEGMVESAMEFLRICRDLDYHDIVLSMKASNTLVMVQAYRLLVATMKQQGMQYPLHLGVTEAGEAEDGRIKSAVGIGTLLADGIGDTIRVSLTEAPEFEAPVAEKLAEQTKAFEQHEKIQIPTGEYPINPYQYTKRSTCEVVNFGGKNVPRIMANLSTKTELKPAHLFGVGYNYSVPLDKWNISDLACDVIYIGDNTLNFEIPGTLTVVSNYTTWLSENSKKAQHFPLLEFEELHRANTLNSACFLRLSDSELLANLNVLKELKNTILVVHTSNAHPILALRSAFVHLIQNGIDLPVLIENTCTTSDEEEFMLSTASTLGALLVDGLTEGICLTAPAIPLQKINSTAFGILQAARTRISRTEYISCPSCGRTLFDLQETTAKIRQRTDHLKGIKIGIMGCIVNGPGEMADADYGYVGTGPGKITLYKEKEVVKKNVPAEQAVDELIELIKSHGDWIEKVEA